MAEVFESSILHCFSNLAITDEDSHLHYAELTKALSRLCKEIYPFLPPGNIQIKARFTKLFLLHLCASVNTSAILKLYKDTPVEIRDHRDIIFARDFIVCFKVCDIEYESFIALWRRADESERLLISYCLTPYRCLIIINLIL
jgi:hypothetical protein